MMIEKKIVFIDDNCLACNSFAHMLLYFDRSNSLYVAPLRGSTYALVFKNNEGHFDDSVIFYNLGKIEIKVKAVSEILKAMRFPFSLLGRLVNLLPLRLMNRFYDFVAQNRHRFKSEAVVCSLREKRDKRRFLF